MLFPGNDFFLQISALLKAHRLSDGNDAAPKVLSGVIKTEMSDDADDNFVDTDRITSTPTPTTSSTRILGSSSASKRNFRDNLIGPDPERLIVPNLGLFWSNFILLGWSGRNHGIRTHALLLRGTKWYLHFEILQLCAFRLLVAHKRLKPF